MDRQATIGFVLIFLVLLAWMWLNAPNPAKQAEARKTAQVHDSTKAVPAPVPAVTPDAAAGPGPASKFFVSRLAGEERIITVETDDYRAELTSRGGLIRSWQLKKYKTWHGDPVQLVNPERGGDPSLLFTTSDGRVVNTRDLVFDVVAPTDHVVLSNNFEFEITFRLPASGGGMIEKVFRFRNGQEGFDAEVRMAAMGSVLSGYEYQLVWEHGIPYAEQNSVDESNFAAAYAYSGKEMTEIDAGKVDQREQKEIAGTIDWVAARNKYFGVALIPTSSKSEGAYLEGIRRAAPNGGFTESYIVALKMPFKGGGAENAAFHVHLGPLKYDVLKSFGNGLENVMSLGWTWLVRPISEYIMLPLFSGLHYLLPNWGLVIIAFSLLIKIALHPLTRTSMRSMQRMQKLQPLMEEIKAKYKDDPQSMNKAVMNLYKEYGVNPMGGCLPIVLQLPIMYALYAVFRSAIELRQASFVGWITDLSIPDIAFSLPFHLPLVGIQDVSGIALLMGVTMFVQQKMTVKDPQQKMMVWMMPIMMTLLFNGFPSGLNLYYAVFNVLSIGQQFFVNKRGEDQPLRKVEQKKKRGGIFRLTKDLPRLNK